MKQYENLAADGSDPSEAHGVGIPQRWAIYRFVSEDLGQDPPVLAGRAADVSACCRPSYERLFERRLRAD